MLLYVYAMCKLLILSKLDLEQIILNRKPVFIKQYLIFILVSS
jgi:hypothetical protein